MVATDRCKDPLLALLICRVVDPENKTGEIEKVTQKWFIDRGEQFNDPFLINIGYWLRKDYIKSVNQLSPDKEDSCLNYFYKKDVREFDLVDQSEKGA